MKNKSFIKNFSLVMSSSASAQLITFLFIPVLSRVYSPEVLGIQNLFLSLTTILIPIGALTLPMAIVLVKREIDINKLASACLNISIFLFLLLNLAAFLIAYLAPNVSFVRGLGGWLYLVPTYLLILTATEVNKKIIVKRKNYLGLSKVNIISSFIGNFSKTIFGLISPTASSLFISLNISAVLTSLYSFKKSGFSYIIIPKKRMKLFLKKYHDFPMFRCPQMLINAFSQDIPVILFSGMYGLSIVGYYGMARVFLTAPVNLMGSTVNSLLYPRFVEKLNAKEDVFTLLKYSTAGLALISIIPFALIYLYGEQVFVFILGSEWGGAGKIAEIMCVMSFFSLIARPSISIIPVINYQKIFLNFEVVSCLFRVASIFLGFNYFSNYLDVIMLLSFFSAFIYFFLTSMIFFVVYKNKFKSR
ncbi:lipopolysaccharide biosynthesis protein [Pseudoalteromonas sp. P1-7a]|uniref:lipopolysaccharide biosynthesis protein n=1 Tax=Pseudoalteromonas sp. P1-7a TaxID=1723755 RepID=UPI0006D67FCF|nr:oligosaccharide flippase family protein [Pseudoalteromonas sp. P1-7a]KPZ53588.1 colanic acid exporter [Pseudoalteromonas sp. P1-7a]